MQKTCPLRPRKDSDLQRVTLLVGKGPTRHQSKTGVVSPIRNDQADFARCPVPAARENAEAQSVKCGEELFCAHPGRGKQPWPSLRSARFSLEVAPAPLFTREFHPQVSASRFGEKPVQHATCDLGDTQPTAPRWTETTRDSSSSRTIHPRHTVEPQPHGSASSAGNS